MKEIFPGEIKVYLIQHIANVLTKEDRQYTNMETAVMGDGRLRKVKEWTDRGMYNGAHIIRHTEPIGQFKTLLPSYRIGIEIAIHEDANYHIWLEDDSLIYDQKCNRWDELIGENDVGVYRDCEHIHTCYLVSRPSFDKRLLPILKHGAVDGIEVFFKGEGRWKPPKGHIEYYTTWACETGRSLLKKNFAARIHRESGYNEIANLVRNVAPLEMKLLELDFEKFRSFPKIPGNDCK